jgi:hypothetical protein
MGMKDPLPTFTTLVERICDVHPKLAFIHVDEPRVQTLTTKTALNQARYWYCGKPGVIALTLR